MSVRPPALLVLLATAALLLALLPGAVFDGEVLSSADLLLARDPWRAVAPDDFTPRFPGMTDPVVQFQPWRMYLRERLAEGELPLWNDRAAAGQPFMANMQSGVFSPYVAPHLLLPFATAELVMQLLKLMVAALFSVLLACRLGASRPAALFAALAYTFGGYQFLWLAWPHSATASLLPLLLYLVERRVGGREEAGVEAGAGAGAEARVEAGAKSGAVAEAADRAQGSDDPSPGAAAPWWSGPALSLGVGALLLTGHVETALHVSLAVALYAVLRQSGDARRRLTELFTIGGWSVIGLGLSAVAVVPFVQYLGLSRAYAERVRFQDLWRVVEWGAAPGWFVLALLVAGAWLFVRRLVRVERPAAMVVAIVALAVFGAWACSLADALGMPDHYRRLVHPDGHGHPVTARGLTYGAELAYFEVNGGYAGLISLPLALLACCVARRRAVVTALGGLWLAAFVVGYEVPVLSDLADHLPLMNISHNRRLMLVVSFAGAMLAALGLDALAGRRPAGERGGLRRFWILALGLSGALALAPHLPWSESLLGSLGVRSLPPAAEPDAPAPRAGAGPPIGDMLRVTNVIAPGQPLVVEGWALTDDGLPTVFIDLVQGERREIVTLSPLEGRGPALEPPPVPADHPFRGLAGFRVEVPLDGYVAGRLHLRLRMATTDHPRQLVRRRSLTVQPDHPVQPRWYVLGGLGAALLLWGSRRRGAKPSTLLPLAGLALLVGDLLLFGRGLQPTIPPEQFYPPNPVTDHLAAVQRTRGPFRVWALGSVILLPNTASVYGLRDLQSYDALEVDRMDILLGALRPQDRERVVLGEVVDVTHPLFSLLDVGYLLAPLAWEPPEGATLSRVLDDGHITLWRNDGPRSRTWLAPRAFSISEFIDSPPPGRTGDPGVVHFDHRRAVMRGVAQAYREDWDPRDAIVIDGPGPSMPRGPPPAPDAVARAFAGEARVVEDGPERLVIETDTNEGGWLVVGDAFFPGWRASVNGEAATIYPAFHALRALKVPAGRSTVEMVYTPAAFRIGLAFSGAALVAMAVAAALASSRRRS